MRASLLGAAALAAVLFQPCLLRAGVYNTSEPPMGPSVTKEGVEALPFKLFRQDVLPDLLQLAVAQPESKLRQHYLKRRDELKAKARRGPLTTEEAVDLSAYLLGLREAGEAVNILEPIARQERRNFMVFANLGTASQLTGEFVRAQNYLGLAKTLLPREWPKLTPEQLTWYRRVEGFQLKLVQLRNQEARGQPGGRARPAEDVDNLFDVRFVGESGHYEAGKIAEAEKKKLPPDAVAIVQQLIVWLPDDTRLYWLLGEVMNGQGDTAAAENVFTDCVWNRRFDAPALQEHRQILQDALPRPEPPAPVGDWAPERRQVEIVAAVAVLLVGVLAYWQVREFRRRRKSGRPAAKA
jgi:hypothetical protein